MKTNRRDFLKSVAMAAAGVLASAAKVKAQEPTESRGQDSIDFGALYSQTGQLSRDRVSEARKMLEDRDVQAGKRMMETYIEGFDLSLLCSGQVNEDRIIEAFTISKTQVQSHRLDALHYIYGTESDLHWNAMAELDAQAEDLAWQMADANRQEFEMSIGIHEYDVSEIDPCQVDFYVQHGRCDDKLIGTVESVNDDGSVNVRIDGAVPVILGHPTYEPAKLDIKLDLL